MCSLTIQVSLIQRRAPGIEANQSYTHFSGTGQKGSAAQNHCPLPALAVKIEKYLGKHCPFDSFQENAYNSGLPQFLMLSFGSETPE